MEKRLGLAKTKPLLLGDLVLSCLVWPNSTGGSTVLDLLSSWLWWRAERSHVDGLGRCHGIEFPWSFLPLSRIKIY